MDLNRELRLGCVDPFLINFIMHVIDANLRSAVIEPSTSRAEEQ